MGKLNWGQSKRPHLTPESSATRIPSSGGRSFAHYKPVLPRIRGGARYGLSDQMLAMTPTIWEHWNTEHLVRPVPRLRGST